MCMHVYKFLSTALQAYTYNPDSFMVVGNLRAVQWILLELSFVRVLIAELLEAKILKLHGRS